MRRRAVSAGGYHSVARDAEGGVWTWGRGEWGRLGHNDAGDCLVPTRVEYADVASVAGAQAGDSHSGCLAPDGTVYTWGRNEHWQLGYEVVGLLNAGQSLEGQQEPQPVELPDESPVALFGCGELGTAAVLENGEVYVWGMARFFSPTRVGGLEGIEGRIVDVQVGAYHCGFLTDAGRLYTFGTGAALAVPRSFREQWSVCDVNAHSLEGRRVLAVACGSNTTAMIMAP